MTRAKRSFSQKMRIPRRQALRRAQAWHWRLGSALMVVLLAAMVAPKSDAAAAATAGPKVPAKPKLNVVVIGDFYSYGYATNSEATLRKSVPPTLQALNEVQAANSGVQVNVLFIPVAMATSSSLFDTGNQAGLPALIRAVAHSSVVIVGIGGGNAPLARPMRSVLFGTAAAAKAFPQLMTTFDDGYYLYSQTALLDAVAAHAAPGTSIVTLGYPAIQGEQRSSGFTWWSPYTWSTVNQQQANMSDQLVSAMNTANGQATSIVAAAHSGLHFLYADLSGAMQGGPSGSQQGQGTPAKTIIGNDLLPYISQAVSNELVAMNVGGAQDAPPATSASSQWQLDVVLPVPTQAPPRHSSRAATPPPQNNQDNPPSPVYQPPAWPGLAASPSAPPVGSLPSAGDGPMASAPPASPSEGSAPTAQDPGKEQHTSPPTARSEPTGTSRPTPQSTPSSEPADTAQPTPEATDTSKPTFTEQPPPQTTAEPKPQPTVEPQPTPQPAAEPQPTPQPTASSQPSAGGASASADCAQSPALSAAAQPDKNQACCARVCVSPSSSTPTATLGPTTPATSGPASSLPATTPAPASTLTATATATATASPRLTPTSGAGGGNSGSPSPATPATTPSPHRPITLPMIPAPPAPLPEPITVTPTSDATGSGTDPSPPGSTATPPAGAGTSPSTAAPPAAAAPPMAAAGSGNGPGGPTDTPGVTTESPGQGTPPATGAAS